MDEVVLFVFNDSEYGIGVELCYLAILCAYFLVSYNTNITRIKERLGLTLNVRLKPLSIHLQLRMKYCRR